MHRRAFLESAGRWSALGTLVSGLTSATGAPAAAPLDLVFASATEALRALRGGSVSCRELMDLIFRRIHRYNPLINAFVTLDEERARSRALEADAALSRGESWGPLHGLPILIKDSFETAGLRTTSGSLTLKDHVPSRDSVAVARLKAAGAIVVGKTNLPEWAGDMQSYNEVAGTTNNPWDLARTPGGSTGGGAAALAAGFGFLELGSDIGGSIRNPCHFCGVFGLKPTLGIVPGEGHIPPPVGATRVPPDLAAYGPMARSAQDLRLELEIIAGPTGPDARAWQWRLPSPRGARLRDYRIGYVLDDPFCPVSESLREPLAEAVASLKAGGAQLEEGWPEGVDFATQYGIYLPLLGAAFSEAISEVDRQEIRRNLDTPLGKEARLWLEGVEMSQQRWRELTAERLRTRAAWQEYFRIYDAFLMPVNFVAAFPHRQKGSFFERELETENGLRPYGDLLKWISLANLTGCPAAVAPVGFTAQGLPAGIQIMGPFMEDATPIDLAGRIADELGVFRPPAGFPA